MAQLRLGYFPERTFFDAPFGQRFPGGRSPAAGAEQSPVSDLPEELPQAPPVPLSADQVRALRDTLEARPHGSWVPRPIVLALLESLTQAWQRIEDLEARLKERG